MQPQPVGRLDADLVRPQPQLLQVHDVPAEHVTRREVRQGGPRHSPSARRAVPSADTASPSASSSRACVTSRSKTLTSTSSSSTWMEYPGGLVTISERPGAASSSFTNIRRAWYTYVCSVVTALRGGRSPTAPG